MPSKETGVPVPVRTWSSGSWSPPKEYDSIEKLLIHLNCTGAGYGPIGQNLELEGGLIVPNSSIYQKVIYAWRDRNDRLQIANSIEEAHELMIELIIFIRKNHTFSITPLFFGNIFQHFLNVSSTPFIRIFFTNITTNFFAHVFILS